MKIKVLLTIFILSATILSANNQKVEKSNKEKILESYDKNRDGIITQKEIPKNMIDHFFLFDFNKNGVIEQVELEALN